MQLSMSSRRGGGGIVRDFDMFPKIAFKFPTPGQKCEVKYQGPNEVYGIRDQRPKKGWDPGSQPRDRDQRCFYWIKDQAFWTTKGIHNALLNRVFKAV